MTPRLQRSLRYEYEVFVDEEIENYKESIPRSALLSVGDEAVARLESGQQILLTELLLCDEVNEIIFRRLRLPGYNAWRKKRIKIAKELRRPEYWGLAPDHVAVRVMAEAAEGRVLMAGVPEDGSALFLAANGCQVTTVNRDHLPLERVMHAANEAGLAERVHTVDSDLSAWEPDAPLSAVICTGAAMAGLSMKQRQRLIEVLQSATADGGVHLLHAIISGSRKKVVSTDELRSRYRGWSVTVDETGGDQNMFMARKDSA